MEKCLVATAALEKVASKNEPIEAATAQSVAQEIKIQQEQVAAKKKTLEELVAKRQYAGAAAAQDELLELQAKEKQMKEKIASKNDPKEAAAAQAVAQEIKTQEEQLAAKNKTLAELVANKDFKRAAAVHVEVLELEKSVLVAREKATGTAKGGERGSRHLCNDHLEEQIRSKTQIRDELVSKREFTRAAAVQAELDDLAKSPSAPPTVKPPLPRVATGTRSEAKGGRNAQRGAGSVSAPVNLDQLRVLSSSKITQVPAKGKGKGKGKAGGRKGGGKKGSGEVPREDFVAIYLGCITTKQIYHVLAFGDSHVDKLRPYVELETQPIVNAKNLERRPGKEDLIVTDDTVISTCLEPTDVDGSARFVYDVSKVTKHLATVEVGKQTALGNFIDLVLRVDSADEMQIQSGQNYGAPYLQISGVDMDGAEVGPLRFWNHERDDV